ncbi:MAG TPA: vanadium-dependent haloperoxidase, partial [Pirellulaceae bacterium]|nr:vanadium-dependent haloperoxidase [Pirellulaceae bacterium]
GQTGGGAATEGTENTEAGVVAVATVRPLSNVVVENESWPPWATPALSLAVGLSPDSDPDGNGVVLRQEVTLVGQTAPSSSVVVEVAAVEYVGADAGAAFATPFATVETTSDSAGRFTIDARLARGANLVRVTARDSHGQQSVFERPLLVGDVIVDWNQALLSVIRDWTTLSNDPYTNRVVTERPPVAARNLAMIHGAMYDAVNAIDGTHAAYRYSPDFSHMSADERAAIEGASPVAAAATAAFDVATRLYREADERAVFAAALAEALATLPDGPSKNSGVAIGHAAAAAMLAARQGDGASSVVSYSPGTAPGEWRRTFPDFLPPLLPQWPDVRPFAMTDGAQFRPPAPPSLDSAEYAANVDEVQRLGGFNSVERTADQTEIALFWADGGGSFTPPGHWNQIATEVSLARGLSLSDNARLFALLDIALADAGIAAWDAKYEYDLWRPIDAIRLAATDGNPATTASPTWIPLLKTPPFPTYISGHSTFSGAADAVLSAVLGDEIKFVDISDGHQGFSTRPLADQQIYVRQFANFTAAAEEAGRSRIYGGIHFQFDNTAGLATGRSIGRYVVDQFLRPLASS